MVNLVGLETIQETMCTSAAHMGIPYLARAVLPAYTLESGLIMSQHARRTTFNMTTNMVMVTTTTMVAMMDQR